MCCLPLITHIRRMGLHQVVGQLTVLRLAVAGVLQRQQQDRATGQSQNHQTCIIKPYKMRIIHKVAECIAKGQNFFSFEFFPPKTEEVGCVCCVLAV